VLLEECPHVFGCLEGGNALVTRPVTNGSVG
jgi:hypothetical protein